MISDVNFSFFLIRFAFIDSFNPLTHVPVVTDRDEPWPYLHL